MTSKEALEIAIKEISKVKKGIEKRLVADSLDFGYEYKYYNSPDALQKALDKQEKYHYAIGTLLSIKKDLDLLAKLEKVIQDYCYIDDFPQGKVIRMFVEENEESNEADFYLLKEVLEND